MSLYDPKLERDNCGFGLLAHMEGEASHKLVRLAMSALARMQHRGGISADGKTGDGCGLLLQKPDSFFRAVAEEKGWHLGRNYAVGMLFLNPDPVLAQATRDIIDEELEKEALSLVGWRKVPIDTNVLGPIAKASCPASNRSLSTPRPAGSTRISSAASISCAAASKRISDDYFYVVSLSNLVTVYKGLCMPVDLPRFYLDLADIRMQAAICVFHQRFSTNTSPRWPLAQPFRYLAHNGEINTIAGNRQWAKARSYKFATPLIPDLQEAAPSSTPRVGSSSLDNMLDLFWLAAWTCSVPCAC